MIGHPGHLAAAVQNSVDDSVISRLAIAPDEHGMGKTMARAAAVQPPDHWHVVTIKPGGLERALRMFALPPVRPSFSPRRVVRAPPTHRVTEALFPGYVFVRFDAAREPWGGLRNVPGVSGLLCNAAGIPHTMPAPVMRKLLEEPEVEAPGARMPAQGKPSWYSLGNMTPDERKTLLQRWLRQDEA